MEHKTLLNQDSYKHNFVIEEKTKSIVSLDSAISAISTSKDVRNPIRIDLDHAHSYIYLPGEIISGFVTVEPCSRKNRGRVDIQLSCSFRVLSDDLHKATKKRSIFKVMINPIWIPENEYQSRFSLTIPPDLPAYNVNDESINGRIEYKLKATYEIAADMPLVLYPKTSVLILISAKISTTDPIYTVPIHSRKEISISIPRDVVLKNKKLRKGEKGTVSAKFSLRTCCFLPGQSIPFTLGIQHMAPVKQIQGIQVLLERITTLQGESGNSIDTTVIDKLILPLVCDLDDYSAYITDQVLHVPNNISPTSHTKGQEIVMPFSIQYSLKVLINMDMHNFLEDIPVRKRDRAYSMMTKIIGSLEQDGGGPAFFYGTTIELNLPVVIGTTSSSTLKQASSLTPVTLPNRLMMVNSPDDYHPLSSVPVRQQGFSNISRRLCSDPTFDRTNLIQQQHQFLSTASLFDQGERVMERPPSAPPLVDFQDLTSPPPY
ncbi:hypothetical protein INT47_006308, partial [Mucor saturninus]